MITKEQAYKIVEIFVKHFEETNTHSKSGMLADANYAELIHLRDLQAWVAAQPSVQATLLHAGCGGEIVQHKP